MVAASKATVFVSGKLHWAKVLGEPVMNYNKDGREWTFELEPNEAGLQAIIKQGLSDRIKGNGYNIGTKGQHKERVPFIPLKKSELNKDGNPNPPIRIYDGADAEWDTAKLIGNGSAADVKLDIRDYGPGKKKGIYPVAIRVTDLVVYQSSEFGAMGGAAVQAKSEPKTDDFNKDFGLDDDVPF
jgi:hypothetical protein